MRHNRPVRLVRHGLPAGGLPLRDALCDGERGRPRSADARPDDGITADSQQDRHPDRLPRRADGLGRLLDQAGPRHRASVPATGAEAVVRSEGVDGDAGAGRRALGGPRGRRTGGARPQGDGRYSKINALNAYAEKQYPGEGAKRTAEALSRQLNIRIDRTIKIDFKGFEKFIDALGGLDIDIERSFTDKSFPTDDDGPDPYKWQTVTFTKGNEHMDGKRALIFVRSRHGSNGENSDFARSRRQQLVLEAVRKKLISVGTLSNPKKVSEIWASISNHVQTDLGAWDVLKFLPIATHFSKSNI